MKPLAEFKDGCCGFLCSADLCDRDRIRRVGDATYIITNWPETA